MEYSLQAWSRDLDLTFDFCMDHEDEPKALNSRGLLFFYLDRMNLPVLKQQQWTNGPKLRITWTCY